MKSLSLVIFWVAMASCLFAQSEIIVKKSKSNDKVITVDVKKEGETERTIKIVTDEDGKEKVYEWTDNGEIPEDVKKELEEAGIDIAMIDGGDGEMVVRVESDGDVERDVRKEVIMIKGDDDGEVVEIEWDGEGEMPDEMKDLMKEHNIEIDMLHEGHGKNHTMKLRKHKDKMKMKRHKAMKDGRRVKRDEIKKYKIVTTDEDGEEQVKEWVEHDGDHDAVIWAGPRGRGQNAFFFSADDRGGQLSDAYMGAQIESAEDGGAGILDVMKDSPADKAGLVRGDIVKRINGARVKSMDDLLGILKYFEPEDKIELTIDRDGNEKNLGLTLGKRPDAYK